MRDLKKLFVFQRSLFLLTLCVLSLSMLTRCDKKHPELIAPTISFPAAPFNIITKIGDGEVMLVWEMENEEDIKNYHIYRKIVDQPKMDLIGISTKMEYCDTNINNGTLYSYQIAAVNSEGYEGRRCEEILAKPNTYHIIIEKGAEYTNHRRVVLAFTADTKVKSMCLSNDSSFSNTLGWEAFSASRNWQLTSGDGMKYVYAKFRDKEGYVTSSIVCDSIFLDTRALISELSENTESHIKVPGQQIHFALDAGEPDGLAMIDIGTEKLGVKLYDDGTRGDAVAGNGVYEVDFEIPAGLSVWNAIITGYFTDRANNVASPITAQGRVSIHLEPFAVTLSPPAQLGTPNNALELHWTRSTDETFSFYRLFRATASGVDTASTLIVTIPDRATITYRDTDLRRNINYFYRVFVYDQFGMAKGSNEVSGKVEDSNELPTPVVLDSPSPVGYSKNSLSLSWSKNEDQDFASYKIYRSREAGVDSTCILIAAIFDQNTTYYEDTDLLKNTGYYYRVYVYNTAGLSIGSNEAFAKTTSNEPPIPVILYSPSPVSNSLTALNLSWSQNEDADFASYKIFRSKTPGVDSTALNVGSITGPAETYYEDTNLQQNTKYYYRVYVYDTGGLSAGSNEVMGQTNANVPPKAVSLAQPAIVDSVTLRLSWSQNNDDDFARYSIYRSDASPVDTTDAPITIINARSTTHYNDTNLVKNKVYYYRVLVTDTGGLSTGSNEVNGAPGP